MSGTKIASAESNALRKPWASLTLTFASLNQFDLHFRHLAEANDRIFAPGVARDAVAVKANALLQSPTGGLDRAAFDLVEHTIGVDRLADIHRYCQPLDDDVLRTLDLRYDRTIGAGVLVARKANSITAAGLRVRLPTRAFRDGADDILRP